MTEILPPPRHFFVVNPVSFYGKREMNEVVGGIHRFFEKPDEKPGGAPQYAVHVSRFPRDAVSAIRRFAAAVPHGVPLRVYAVGGDGILFDCLNGIVGLPNAELGTIPCGPRNNFYRVFGQRDQKIFHSLQAQTSAPSVPMDVLYCGSNYALSYCLIGLESVANVGARMRRNRRDFLHRHLPGFFHSLDFCSGFAGTLLNRVNFKQNYRMWVDNEDLSGKHIAINIANSPWFATGRTVVPEAVPSDGWLDVLCSGDASMLTACRMMFYYMRGKHADYPDLFLYRRAKKVFVTSDSPLVLNLDGEVFYDKYITVETKPGAVRIIAPAGAADEAAPREQGHECQP
ncbi:MAG: hypothetical protein LBT71_07555 [Azoarcus sp.]|jgi:diacylglycerol kinase family enzyme|nr:hypothetical protein [Azoarcus sp.]